MGLVPFFALFLLLLPPLLLGLPIKKLISSLSTTLKPPPPVAFPLPLSQIPPPVNLSSLSPKTQLQLCLKKGVCPFSNGDNQFRPFIGEFEKGCRERDPTGCWVAGLYWEAHQHLQLAERLYLRSCLLGGGEGCDHYSFLLLFTFTPSKERLELGRKIAWRGCQLGAPGACLHLANSYSSPASPVEQKLQFLLYWRGCQLGAPEGCLSAGDYYLYFRRAFSKALPFYWRGCRLDFETCFRLLPRFLKGGAPGEGERLKKYLCKVQPSNPSCDRKSLPPPPPGVE